MSDSKPKQPGDDALGLNAPIDRRDLLNSTLLAAGSVLLGSIAPFQLIAEEDWTGYGGVGDYARSNGNTYEVMTDGHKIRDHVFDGKRPRIRSIQERYLTAWWSAAASAGSRLRSSFNGKAGEIEAAWCSRIIPSSGVRRSAMNLTWMGSD